MKVLFIGEGPHDIGDPGPNPFIPRPAQGTIPTLARRVCPSIRPESVALAWTEIRRFNPQGKKGGYESKIPAAVLIAARKFNCSGSVFVTDQDRKAERRAALEAGLANAMNLFPGHRLACGLAVESVEAWTLAVPDAIAEVLGLSADLVRQQYPGINVESLYEKSGKEEHRPKRLIERIGQLRHQSDSTAFRQAVAEETDVAELERACPVGFRPFAEQLRAAFGQ